MTQQPQEQEQRDKMRRCPFCDSAFLARGGSQFGHPGVECRECGAIGPTGDDDDDAESRWNTRIANSERLAPSGDVERAAKVADAEAQRLANLPRYGCPGASQQYGAQAGTARTIAKAIRALPASFNLPSDVVEAAAQAMCDRVNGQGDYDANIDQRRSGWMAQAEEGIKAYLAALSAPSGDVEGVANALANADTVPPDDSDEYWPHLARAAIAALSAPSAGEGAVERMLVPRDDDSRSFADSILPEAMIDAGEAALERAQHDMLNYVPGETTDWDSGMIVVAIYRAMLAALTTPTTGDTSATREEASPATCERCQGNGEIVTDWDRYKHPRPGDVGDEAVALCPDCHGEGHAATREEGREG